MRSSGGCKLPDLTLIQRRLGIEVEAVQFAYEGELSQLARHGDAPLVAASNLPRDKEGQGFAQGHLRTCRFVQQRIELVADCRQLQPIERCNEHGRDLRSSSRSPSDNRLVFREWQQQGGWSDINGELRAPALRSRLHRQNERGPRSVVVAHGKRVVCDDLAAGRIITRPGRTTTWTLSPIRHQGHGVACFAIIGIGDPKVITADGVNTSAEQRKSSLKAAQAEIGVLAIA